MLLHLFQAVVPKMPFEVRKDYKGEHRLGRLSSFLLRQVLLVNGLFGNVDNWAVVKVRPPVIQALPYSQSCISCTFACAPSSQSVLCRPDPHPYSAAGQSGGAHRRVGPAACCLHSQFALQGLPQMHCTVLYRLCIVAGLVVSLGEPVCTRRFQRNLGLSQDKPQLHQAGHVTSSESARARSSLLICTAHS